MEQTSFERFDQLGLKQEILDAIKDLGFETPTPIQLKTIPHILTSDKDIVALAQTGTGKTAAFGLPILNKIDVHSQSIQALVLSPTRELGMQIAKDIENYSKNMKGLKVVSVYGGAAIYNQIKELEKKPQIVVGTPGRMLDLIKRKKLNINNIKWVVLDEADEMLSMGFKEDMNSILAETPAERNTFLFSATMPREIEQIAKNYMQNAEYISAGQRNVGAKTVKHFYYVVSAKDRYSALKRIADINPDIYGIVFCRTRMETKEVADSLMTDGYNADALHGDLSQAQRDHVMQRFRNGNLQILVATDVAARGLDVNDLTHVINYNLPDELEAYIHRSGRTGRAGKEGISITIIHSRETHKIKELEKKIGKSFEHKPVPGGKEICTKQLFHMVDKVKNVEVNTEEIKPFLPEVYEKFEGLTREELIQHFVSAEFSRFLEYYKNARDLNFVKPDSGSDRGDRKSRTRDRDRGESSFGRGERSERGERGERSPRKESADFTRFYINLGKNNNITPGALMGIVNKYTKISDAQFGGIDIMKKFTFFDFDSRYKNELIKALHGNIVDEVTVVLEQTKMETGGFDKSSKSDDNPKKRASRSSNRGDYREKSDRGFSGGGNFRGNDRRKTSTRRKSM